MRMVPLAASTTLTAIVFAVAGVALVAGVSAIFWLIGRGEDRERERDEARRQQHEPREPPPRFRRRP
jgi:hypothetical protein